MTTAVFKSGNSLCVRLPKGYELPVGRVIIEKGDGGLVIKSGENGYPVDFWEFFSKNADDTWERPEQPETPEIPSW